MVSYFFVNHPSVGLVNIAFEDDQQNLVVMIEFEVMRHNVFKYVTRLCHLSGGVVRPDTDGGLGHRGSPPLGPGAR